jgi:2-dehydropantoate 2-reductase
VKLAIVGAGAIGAFLGAKLSNAGHEVYLIARGPHLRAMQTNGVKVLSPEGDFQARPVATDDYESVGPVDFVFLTVKAHSLPQIAPMLGPLLGPGTAVVSAQNGIPWWYFQIHGGPLEGTRLESLDPGGVISAAIAPERVIGCIIYPSTVVLEPGVIQHTEGDRFTIGELDGTTTDRSRRLASVLTESGLKSRIRSRIRSELWVKLMGNLAFNPISALTRATLVEIVTHSGAGALARAIMEEADEVARAVGVEIPISIDRRMAGAEKVGQHKTSMLQDLEAGRPLELESVVGAVVELGDNLDVAIPNIKAVYACTKLLAQGASRG